MKLLREITESDVHIPEPKDIYSTTYEVRKSARAVLLNEQGEVSLQFIKTKNYYKLPGGGIDPGESVEDALKREIREEVGCEITIEQPIGMTIEYGTSLQLLHLSYAYIARVAGPIGNPSYEKEEMEEGFEPVWVASIEKAIEVLEAHRSNIDYRAPFIIERELTFLREALRISHAS